MNAMKLVVLDVPIVVHSDPKVTTVWIPECGGCVRPFHRMLYNWLVRQFGGSNITNNEKVTNGVTTLVISCSGNDFLQRLSSEYKNVTEVDEATKGM